ncbi:MAG: helix-turn-helix transcriptional regulator [Xanthobacteraceae bacterium]
MLRFEDYVERTRRTETVSELAQQFSDVVRAEGYENSILTSVRGKKLGHIAWFEFPEGYVDAYVDRQWDRIDPVLACSLQASRAFLWSDVVEQTKLSREQLRFMDECKDLCVHSGIIFPFHRPRRRLDVSRLDVISISRRAAEQPDPACSSLLQAISAQTWTRYLELSKEEIFLQSEAVSLTPRELEILRWCKDGKTRRDIGEILSISHKTVEFHLANIMNKLGATNQMTAVVIAIQKGIIDL